MILQKEWNKWPHSYSPKILSLNEYRYSGRPTRCQRTWQRIIELLEINFTGSDCLNSYHKLREQPWAKMLHLPMSTFFWPNRRQQSGFLAWTTFDLWLFIQHLGHFGHIGESVLFILFLVFVILNNHNPSIKLKSILSLAAVDFLCTTTFKGPGFHDSCKLDIKVFVFCFFFSRRKILTLSPKNPNPKHTCAVQCCSPNRPLEGSTGPFLETFLQNFTWLNQTVHKRLNPDLLVFYSISTKTCRTTKVLLTTLSTRGENMSFFLKVFKEF